MESNANEALILAGERPYDDANVAHMLAQSIAVKIMQDSSTELVRLMEKISTFLY